MDSKPITKPQQAYKTAKQNTDILLRICQNIERIMQKKDTVMSANINIKVQQVMENCKNMHQICHNNTIFFLEVLPKTFIIWNRPNDIIQNCRRNILLLYKKYQTARNIEEKHIHLSLIHI